MCYLQHITKNNLTVLQNRLHNYASQISSAYHDSRIEKITNSILGQKAVHSVVENVAEFVGYYGGAIICAPIGRKIGGSLLEKAGKGAAIALSFFGSGKATALVYSKSTNLDSSIKRGLICALTFFPSAYLIHTACSENFRKLGESIGETSGEFLTYTSAGLLTAFAAIKYCNSTERLWGDDIVQSYTFKTLQSLVICAIVDYYGFFPSNAILNPIANFVLGSLIYNALDISNFLKSTVKGTLLSELSHYTPDLKLLQPLFHHSIKRSIDCSITYISNHKNAAEKKFMGQMQTKVIDQLMDLVEMNPSMTTTSNSLRKDLIDKAAFSTIVRSCNLYFHLLATQPNLLNGYDDKSDQLQKIILAKIVMLSDSVGVDKKLLNAMNLDKDGLLQSKVEEAINPLFVPTQMIENIGENLVNLICSTEVKVIGFNFLSEMQKIEARKKLEKHVTWIFKLAPLLFPLSLEKTSTKEELREFYKNVNSFFSTYYQSAIGKPCTSLIEKMLNYQIKNSIK